MYTCIHAPAGGTNTDRPQSGGGSSSGVVTIAVIVVIALLALIAILAISIAAICKLKTPSIFVKVLLHVSTIHAYMYYSGTQQNTHIYMYMCVFQFSYFQERGSFTIKGRSTIRSDGVLWDGETMIDVEERDNVMTLEVKEKEEESKYASVVASLKVQPQPSVDLTVQCQESDVKKTKVSQT